MDAPAPDFSAPLPLVSWEAAELEPGVVRGGPPPSAGVLPNARYAVVIACSVTALDGTLTGSVAMLARILERGADELLLQGLARVRIQRVDGELARIVPLEDRANDRVAVLATELARLPLTPAVREVVDHQLDLLLGLSSGSTEAARIRSHLEWITHLPWAEPAADRDPDRFERVMHSLAESHVGLDDVKKRIAEFLAVRELGGGSQGTVLLFHGPPGTGKSSLGRSVAEALGRPFLTIPVGAILRERELAGSPYRLSTGQPGAILQGLARGGAPNAVVLLDEIDKLSFGGEGDAAGALLQILDCDQNGEFFDHYLGAPFDLSRCVFLATANETEDLPEALLDRMETIEFSSFTEAEKVRIARKHLIPRAVEQAGLSDADLKVTPAALKEILRGYTEEAGVRQFHRLILKLARAAAVRVLEENRGLWVKKGDLSRLLGPKSAEEELRHDRPEIGVATGLAWTSAGGSLLPIEILAMPGSGRTILTGSVGEVLRESVQTAISFVRSRFDGLDLAPDALDHLDLHLHFPSASTPKDGPSAGIAITVAVLSVLTDQPLRHDVALSGELSLRGSVLPVGGVREKLLAAIRNGIREVVLPAGNAEEVLRLAPALRAQVSVHLVDHADELLPLVLAQPIRTRRGPRRVGRRRSDRRARGG
ncbi:MAG: S16 family serine protease [Planctomycetota bacterium]